LCAFLFEKSCKEIILWYNIVKYIRRLAMRKILLLISVLSLGSVCSAAILIVDDNGPADYNKIQAAINDANNGDTIIVQPGTYTGNGNRDIDFLGKAITVRSTDTNDPDIVAATVIDCNGSIGDNHRGFYFHTGEGLDSIVSGFTITNGYVYDANGGAVYCSGSSPTIMDCNITNNTAKGRHGAYDLSYKGSNGRGGGIFCTLASSPEITGCILTNNSALGGIFGGHNPTVANCNGYGGAISCTSGSNPTVAACIISNNRAVGAYGDDGHYSRGGFAYGGAISCESNSNPIITDNTITGNKAIGAAGHQGDLEGHASGGGDACGGAIYNDSLSEPIIKDCYISANLASAGNGGEGFHFDKAGDGGYSYGGGICACGGGAGTIRNCVIINNSATGGRGGNAYAYDGCYQAGNGGSAYGGGIYGYSGEKIVRNCAITNNVVAGGNGGAEGTGLGSSGNGGYAYGGGVCFNSIDNPDTIINCSTLASNIAAKGIKGVGSIGVDGHSYGGGVYSSIDVNFIIRDSIIWTNSAEYNTQIYLVAGSVSFSDVLYGYSGVGNINADPRFAGTGIGDYHLKSQAGRWNPDTQSWVKDDVTSPCIDAGDPNSDWKAELWPNGRRINMGAYGGTPQASMSLSTSCSIADLDKDCDVDFNDLKLFTEKWLVQQVLLAADLDRNGDVNFIDYAIFGNEYYKENSEPGLTYQIGGCGGSLAVREADTPRFTITVDGHYMHFEDTLTENCCLESISLVMGVSGYQILIREEIILGLYLCTCTCDYPITADLGLFKPGTYTVEVVEFYYDDGLYYEVGIATVIIE
jgi:hypothetical protein